ncbi:transporter substrate-binding domain-containing protein [Vibrio nigripulchritudo]|uniref:transporter substrate-binding domain-containing protein n=1 Tax=Vibrio nigripulchritudo TaxID=28173 RepID=UPI000A72210A|nr:transporter substrate-binding domain-containing protein [Vibrio nigripulchritudo]
MVVKVGVLFSQSGPMSMTEHAHIEGILLACAEINAQANERALQFEPVILDPQGDDKRYAQLATELMLEHKVSAIFGCCLSSSRKAVLPIIDRFNGILLYPSVYEGFEYSPNVIYGGAIPNQVVLPLLEYIYRHLGKRVILVGSDTLYAREVNRIVKEFLGESEGIVIREVYFPFGTESDQFLPLLNQINENDVDAVISTVVGNDSVALYESYGQSQLAGSEIPIASLTTTEAELSKVAPKARAGHLSVSPYFSSLSNSENPAFVKAFHHRYGDSVLPSVYSETCYVQMHMLANAILYCDDLSTESILSGLSGSVFKSPSGDKYLDPVTNHFSHRPCIGKAQEDGRFDIVWKSQSVIIPDPYLVTYSRTVTMKTESELE